MSCIKMGDCSLEFLICKDRIIKSPLELAVLIVRPFMTITSSYLNVLCTLTVSWCPAHCTHAHPRTHQSLSNYITHEYITSSAKRKVLVSGEKR